MRRQARAPKTRLFGAEAFTKTGNTVLRWLGNAGLFINSRGTCMMIDPLLEGFDMPLLIDMPIDPKDVPRLDGVLVTHSDNDHFSIPTCMDMAPVCKKYHGPHYVSELMKGMGIDGAGHDIGEKFSIGSVGVTLTPADHAWQNEYNNFDRIFKPEDFCGYLLETEDGRIWIPGDSRLLPEHLTMSNLDVILFDFSNNSWHIGLENAIRVANHYPDTHLILSHWGSVDAPDMDPFNADPKSLEGRVINQERIHIVAPGEAFVIGK